MAGGGGGRREGGGGRGKRAGAGAQGRAPWRDLLGLVAEGRGKRRQLFLFVIVFW